MKDLPVVPKGVDIKTVNRNQMLTGGRDAACVTFVCIVVTRAKSICQSGTVTLSVRMCSRVDPVEQAHMES